MGTLPTNILDDTASYYSVEITGPDLYLSVNLVSRAHMHLAEAALDIVRVSLHVDQPESAQQANDATEF